MVKVNGAETAHDGLTVEELLRKMDYDPQMSVQAGASIKLILIADIIGIGACCQPYFR